MSDAGNRIIEGATEALAVARGEAPAASIYHNGHRYVPETALATAREEGRREGIEEAAKEIGSGRMRDALREKIDAPADIIHDAMQAIAAARIRALKEKQP